MSKKQYIETFSNIHPSDESIERIMNMTNKKHFVSFRKNLIAVIAAISILFSIGIIANAATDGAVAETASKVYEAISDKIIVLVNGKETEANVVVTEKTNEDGENHFEAEINIDIPDKDAYVKYKVELDDNTDISDIDDALSESIGEIIINNPKAE